MTIAFIRHGMTEANEKKLFCGRTDIGLSERGIAELLILKETVSYPKGMYVTSGLKRAASTLNILYEGAEPVIIRELMEYDFGDFEMKSHQELQYLENYNLWLNDENYEIPNGESRKEFKERVKTGIEKLKKISRNTVCVCHGGVISVAMESLFPGKSDFIGGPPFGRGYTVDFGVNIDYKKI